jgi:tRNA threonylcarbamoyl adenosine modification protein YeaZ
LGIDTSAGVSVGLADGDTVVARAWLDDSRRHVEALAPLLVELLDQAGASVNDVGTAVVGLGPGPFTGLRVGIVAAQTWAAVAGCQLRQVCSLDVLGLAQSQRPDCPEQFIACLDARRRELYWASYDAGGRRLTEPAVSRPADLPALPLAGPGARLYAGVGSGLAPGQLDRVDAGLMAQRHLDLASAGSSPLYLRRPDATVGGPAKSTIPGRQP